MKKIKNSNLARGPPGWSPRPTSGPRSIGWEPLGYGRPIFIGVDRVLNCRYGDSRGCRQQKQSCYKVTVF